MDVWRGTLPPTHRQSDCDVRKRLWQAADVWCIAGPGKQWVPTIGSDRDNGVDAMHYII